MNCRGDYLGSRVSAGAEPDTRAPGCRLPAGAAWPQKPQTHALTHVHACAWMPAAQHARARTGTLTRRHVHTCRGAHLCTYVHTRAGEARFRFLNCDTVSPAV